jgi:hypothetical protein
MVLKYPNKLVRLSTVLITSPFLTVVLEHLGRQAGHGPRKKTKAMTKKKNIEKTWFQQRNIFFGIIKNSFFCRNITIFLLSLSFYGFNDKSTFAVVTVW